jgi:hypothetical protein
MKKKHKNMVRSTTLMVVSMIFLFCGVFWKEEGFEGNGIIFIMYSLYLALWVAAGIVRDDVCAKLEEIKDEIGKNSAVVKVR